MEIEISKEAATELEEAVAWYEQEEAGLGARLVDAFEHAVQLPGEPNPPLTPVPGKAASLGARKLILHRFPFSLVVRQFRHRMVIVAFAHHAREPGYWTKRVHR